MHELSTTEGIVESAIAFAKEKKAISVSKVRVEIGELTFLNPEQMKFAYGVVTKGTILEGSKLVIEVKRPSFVCLECGESGNSLPKGAFHCPKCGGDIKITSGRQCIIRSMEMEP